MELAHAVIRFRAEDVNGGGFDVPGKPICPAAEGRWKENGGHPPIIRNPGALWIRWPGLGTPKNRLELGYDCL